MTFQLDTSGRVIIEVSEAFETYYEWSDLSPFTQGYIEALFEERFQFGGGFSDLAPETLARIIADCESARPRYVIPGYPGGPESGRTFWIDRQSPEHIHGFPPLTVQLGDDGKVRFAELARAPSPTHPEQPTPEGRANGDAQ